MTGRKDPAPRIYHYRTERLGPLAAWTCEVRRASELGFNSVLFSQFYLLPQDPGVAPPIAASAATRIGAEPWDTLESVVRECRDAGIKPIVELSFEAIPNEAPIVAANADWVRPDVSHGDLAIDPRAQAGQRFAVDPRTAGEDALFGEYVCALVRVLAARGFGGILCRGAHRFPASLWRATIADAKRLQKAFMTIADVLGATPDEVAALAPAGFDYLLNSLAWWDGRRSWAIEQYNAYRSVAPSISFPLPFNGEGDAAPSNRESDAFRKGRLLLAAAFSSGLLVPMGYELGLSVDGSSGDGPDGDWDMLRRRAAYDLSPFVAAVNKTKSKISLLNHETLQARVTSGGSGTIGLVRFNRDHDAASDQATVMLLNTNPLDSHALDPGTLLRAGGGRINTFTDITPGAEERAIDAGQSIDLAPLEAKLLLGRGRPERRRGSGGTATKRVSDARLATLARSRIAIERVGPEIDGGRFAIKRVIGDVFRVEADIYCDGHDQIAACVQFRADGEKTWHEIPMTHVDNDRWAASVTLTNKARHMYTIAAWRDLYASWCAEVAKKHDAGREITVELEEGRILVAKSLTRLKGKDKSAVERLLEEIDRRASDSGGRLAVMLDPAARALLSRIAERVNLTVFPRELEVWVDRPAAVFSAWYELFPRSQSGDPARHGTFDDVIRRLPYVRDMGFDVLYFPPIHPIGRTNRKGRNNSLDAKPGDPGSVYAIGAGDGGHDSLDPNLGSLADFRRLIGSAHAHGMEIAIDFAIQCSPDHPWIREHPEWFDWRPDGTIKFAENPPKKYEDIVNVHFYRQALPSIWHELRDVVLFWVRQGVKIFRVDNPHTKPLPFWEWMIREVTDRDPDVIFLSEAFTRPKMMKRLAKVGFQQSYTYFTWRNTKRELTEYLTELSQSECREYYRPNFFTNTPDINPFFLQTGGRAAFQIRAALAATLSPSYGIYSGFELCEGRALPGREEYLDSEKYEIKAWDWDRPGNIRGYIRRLNRIRRDNPALWRLDNLRFYNAWNENILYYGKLGGANEDTILVAVNLDPNNPHSFQCEIPLWEFGLPDHASIGAEELLTDHPVRWTGKVQQIRLDPNSNPCAIWRLTPGGAAA